MNQKEKKIYCSLDIETSGFDPLKNEILEVGFVLFTAESGVFTILEEYTKVFKPRGEVSATILGLTGITQEELDAALPLEQFKAEIQEKIADTIIVGHNVAFDIKFLETAGLTFSGKVVDTLDMVQFILPTHHSYNLENLMHYFQVDHKNAHRALADARACLVVLEKMLQVYTAFSKELRSQLVAIGKQHNFFWTWLFEAFEPARSLPVAKTSTQVEIVPAAVPLELANNIILNFPVGKNLVEELVAGLLPQKKKILLVLPKMSQVIHAWKRGLAQGAFGPEVLFDEDRFTALLQKTNISPEEAKFALKVLVWKYTNWQTECIFDLNLSFFGGQFRNLITGRQPVENKDAKIVCCDLQAFSFLSRRKLYKNRFVVLVGLNEFEQYISSTQSVKASWSYITYLLKSFYNPELETGNAAAKQAVVTGLSKTDLFFGLVQALLKPDDQSFQYYTIDANSVYSQSFVKIQQAAENFSTFLLQLSEQLKSEEIQKFAENLKTFFVADQRYVKWIELAEARCVLFSTPLDISESVEDALAAFSARAFVDALGSKELINYFISRLGLSHFSVVPVTAKQSVLKQQKLFVKNSGHIPAKKKSVHCALQAKVLTPEQLFALVDKASLPAAVLFSSALQIREFYDQYYKVLQKKAFLVAQNSSGGSNKMFHNFSIHSHSLLLGTGRAILKHVATSSNTDPVEHLTVKTLIICNLPFEQYTHPYQLAVSARFSNPFEEYSLPKAVYNFHALLEFFNTEELEQLYICDAKLAKPYAKVFTDYLEQIESLIVE